MEWECHQCGRHHASVPAACEGCGTKPEIVLNVWRCAHCGAEGIAGGASRCPGCGVDRGLGVETAVDTSARVEGELGRKLADGAWRYCAYCDVQVPPVDNLGLPSTQCPSCGGPLSESTREAVAEEVSAVEAGRYRAVATKDAAAQPAPSKPAPNNKRTVWPWIVAPLLLVGGVVGYFALRGPSSFVVADKHWTHELAVEAFGPVSEQAWIGQVPASARGRSCSREIHHHDRVARGTETVNERVADGRRCSSYGYKKKGGVSVKTCTNWQTTYRQERRTRTRYVQVPVYRLSCRYTVDKWHTARTVKVEGGAANAPRWPAEGDELKTGERAGARTASYTLQLKDPKGEERMTYTCRDLTEWQRYAVSAAVLAKVSLGGTVKELAPAK